MKRDCEWTNSFGITKEKTGCKEHSTNLIGNEISGKTPKSCDLLCILQTECKSFRFGRAGSAREGYCSLYKNTCTEEPDQDHDMYVSSQKETPSIEFGKCTHIPAIAGDKGEV